MPHPCVESPLIDIPRSARIPRTPRIYDTTLRDGNQAFGVNFSVDDKIKIATKLSEFGVDYVEGGWPNALSPAETEFFKRIEREHMTSAIVAFGITRRPNVKCIDDPNLRVLSSIQAEYVTIMGKTSTLHVERILGTSLDENLLMISESIQHLCDRGHNVIFDAEHFYDGYKENPRYALDVVRTAEKAGAREIVLCDTRGSSIPIEIYQITSKVRHTTSRPIGVHAHNDRGLATANSLFALMAGAEQIQGTINGLGERCGNADLVQVIGNLAVTSNIGAHLDVSKLTGLSEYVYEIANVRRNDYQPFVGKFAFAHKAGIHGDAVSKDPNAYEWLDPSTVGNTRSIGVSSQSGRANIILKAREFGFNLKKDASDVTKILQEVKRREAVGYHYENAAASLNLLYARALGMDLSFFGLMNWRAFVVSESAKVSAESTVKLEMGGDALITAAEGNGPVNAFDIALRSALQKQYPELSKVQLAGYRVREIDVEKGTAAAVQVFVEFEADGKRWSTIGVSPNILKASEEALVDGYLYYLYETRRHDKLEPGSGSPRKP